MDHGWDEPTRQDRTERAERERFATSRVARDPDVERRDRLREAERWRAINQSPWTIGLSFYDQRDLYTRNASIDTDGYELGPDIHPEEGSYAYHREFHPGFHMLREGDATLFEREAWPWLNYKPLHDSPYYAHLHEHEHELQRERKDDARPRGPWSRLRTWADKAWSRFVETLVPGAWPNPPFRVRDALRDTRAHASLAREGARQLIEPSDLRLERDVRAALVRERDLDASDIEVDVRRGEVTLRGTVIDRRSKTLAARTCEAVHGVRSVHNRLTIRREDPTETKLVLA
jgi:hypothetical protein